MRERAMRETDRQKEKYYKNIAFSFASDKYSTIRLERATAYFDLDFNLDLPFGKFRMTISPQPVIQCTSCLVLGWGFQGQRSKWRYFQFNQVQGGAILEKFKW